MQLNISILFFFKSQKSKLKLVDIFSILYCFGIDFQVYQCNKLFPHIDEKTIIDWYYILRDVCSTSLLANPVKLGDGTTSEIIEIDESLFGKKRKYNRGTGNQKYWVFGMVERGTKKAVLQLVEKRDRASLLPIIENYVEKGSSIFSDQWSAYFTLAQEGYNHLTVNHSKEFKSDNGCCTNAIEGLWSLAKLKLKQEAHGPHRSPE